MVELHPGCFSYSIRTVSDKNAIKNEISSMSIEMICHWSVAPPYPPLRSSVLDFFGRVLGLPKGPLRDSRENFCSEEERNRNSRTTHTRNHFAISTLTSLLLSYKLLRNWLNWKENLKNQKNWDKPRIRKTEIKVINRKQKRSSACIKCKRQNTTQQKCWR